MMSAKRWLFGLLCGGAFAVLGASAVLAADTSAVSTSNTVIAAAPAGDEAGSAALRMWRSARIEGGVRSWGRAILRAPPQPPRRPA